jgi:hypothetical protein
MECMIDHEHIVMMRGLSSNRLPGRKWSSKIVIVVIRIIIIIVITMPLSNAQSFLMYPGFGTYWEPLIFARRNRVRLYDYFRPGGGDGGGGGVLCCILVIGSYKAPRGTPHIYTIVLLERA